MKNSKFLKFCDVVEKLEDTVMDFNKEFTVFNLNNRPSEEGYYLTIRLFPDGIRKKVDEWKYDRWLLENFMGSKVIAFSNKKITV